MKVRANGLSLPDLDTLAALETGRYWTPAKRPGEPLYRPAINNGYWAEDIITDGLVLYVPLWLYSGAKFPSVDAHKHTCTVTGATWGIQGRSFDGINDWITVPDAPVFRGTGSFSVETWIKSANLTQDAQGVINATQVSRWQLRTFSNGTIFWDVMDTIGNKTIVSTTLISINTWYHIVGIYDAENSVIRLFINRVAETPVAIGTCVENTGGILIGDNSGGPGSIYTFDGLIGEARIYNRALSAAEVLHNYKVTRWRYA